MKLLGIDDLFHLRSQCVERPAERGYENEGADEDSGIEVQTQQELAEPTLVRIWNR